jgi:hypothetical protein
MTSARIIGVAVGNGRFQDELCDALAPLLPIERCRTDRELLALAAQHVLGGAIVGHELLGLDRHVFPALVRNDIPTVLLVLERDIPRRLAALALDGGATRVRILPLGAAPNTIAAALVELRTGAVANLEHTAPYVVEMPRRATPARTQSNRGRVYGFVGPGGTGCTTHVANLLLALGAAEDVVGIDLDPVAPMLVPLLNADPSLGLDGILKAQAAGVSSLERALEANLQPVPQAARAPRAQLLGGLPLHGGRRPVLSVELLEQLLALLAARSSLVLVDVGRLLPDRERLGMMQRSVLAGLDGVLVVGGGDRPSVLRTCDAVAQLLPDPDNAAPAPRISFDHLALVLNRYDAALMDRPADIAGQVGLPLAACVVSDERSMRRAVYTHQPAVLAGRGSAASDLVRLADALAAGDWPPRVAARRSLVARLARVVRLRLAPLRRKWVRSRTPKMPGAGYVRHSLRRGARRKPWTAPVAEAPEGSS